MKQLNINIYQIDIRRDEKRIAFMNLDSMERITDSSSIDSSSYDLIFSGEVDCRNLEEIFQKFNLDQPCDFFGRSLSVSDVVEVIDRQGQSEFFYCDDIGFKRVEFNSDQAKVPSYEKVRGILLEPGKEARVVSIPNTLEAKQHLVGGYIEQYCPYEEDIAIICNEEGKIEGLPANRAIYAEPQTKEMTYGEMVCKFRAAERSRERKHLTGYIVFTEDSFTQPYSEEARTYCISSNNKAFIPNMGGYSIYGSSLDGTDSMVRLERYMADEIGGKDGWHIEKCYMKVPSREMLDIICGSCFICGIGDGVYVDLTNEQIHRYMEMFKSPERFCNIGGKIVAIPYEPEKAKEAQER